MLFRSCSVVVPHQSKFHVKSVYCYASLLKAHKDRLYYPVCQAISYLFIVYFMGWILFLYVVAKFYCEESLSHEYTKMKNVVHYGIKNVSCLKTLGFKA